MATLQELRGLFRNSDLTEKIESAIIISANDLISGTPSTDEQKWAAVVFGNPTSEARKAMMAVLAENESLSTSAILNATDNAIKSQVEAVVSTLVIANTSGV